LSLGARLSVPLHIHCAVNSELVPVIRLAENAVRRNDVFVSIVQSRYLNIK
jgi:hypothetical protein